MKNGNSIGVRVVIMKCPVCKSDMRENKESIHRYCLSCCMVCGEKFKSSDIEDKLFHATGLYAVHKKCISNDYNRIFWWTNSELENYCLRYHTVTDTCFKLKGDRK